jgi:hypothetical protein
MLDAPLWVRYISNLDTDVLMLGREQYRLGATSEE